MDLETEMFKIDDLINKRNALKEDIRKMDESLKNMFSYFVDNEFDELMDEEQYDGILDVLKEEMTYCMGVKRPNGKKRFEFEQAEDMKGKEPDPIEKILNI